MLMKRIPVKQPVPAPLDAGNLITRTHTGASVEMESAFGCEFGRWNLVDMHMRSKQFVLIERQSLVLPNEALRL